MARTATQTSACATLSSAKTQTWQLPITWRRTTRASPLSPGQVASSFEGRFLVHCGRVEVLEGDWPGDVVIIEFPDVAMARSWYHSPPTRSSSRCGPVI
ncbi:DUF1330 domain-containing protein [Saccharopolyspora mangrovi]|uniref:DUF1330 domain-containing protein n=1 Tax=Saccharopolyspora mangrovi TaxID=3082379 RepID=A0ABU6AJC0_9PSEU|nr:DUF1330 domain-containing protein [Saccharopolyspora sp. S2-29]MEB3371598.1 DUF1330 domain-containing protein [Saccharopolyspora sp. S2-29]